MIGNLMHHFGMTYEECLNRSYKNIVLLNASIPGIEPYEERKKREEQKEVKVGVLQFIEQQENKQINRLK